MEAILWRGRCMANLHTEAVVCDSCNSKKKKEVARISSNKGKPQFRVLGHLVAALQGSHLTPHGVSFPIGGLFSPPPIGSFSFRYRPFLSSTPHWPPSIPPFTRLDPAPRGLIHSVFSLSRIRIPVIVVDSVWLRRYNYNTRAGPPVT